MAQEVRMNQAVWLGRAQAALKVLQGQEQVDPDRIAAIGYCFGGSTALVLAASGAPLKAVSTFHAGLPAPDGRPGQEDQGPHPHQQRGGRRVRVEGVDREVRRRPWTRRGSSTSSRTTPGRSTASRSRRRTSTRSRGWPTTRRPTPSRGSTCATCSRTRSGSRLEASRPASAGGLSDITRRRTPGGSPDPAMHSHPHAFTSFNPLVREGLALPSRRNLLKAGLAGVGGLTLPGLLRARRVVGAARQESSSCCGWPAGRATSTPRTPSRTGRRRTAGRSASPRRSCPASSSASTCRSSRRCSTASPSSARSTAGTATTSRTR